MKMFGKKSLSEALYWLFVLCFIILIISIVRVFCSYADGDYSIINYEGSPIILNSLFLIIPKTVSFLLLVMIFKSFKSDVIFTAKTLTYLNLFTVFSLCMPIVGVLFNYLSFKSEIDFFSINEITLDILNTMFSGFLIGIFTAYITAIFKKGFHLKQENDLTI
jgi:uncharacterized membrane protein